MNETRHLIGSPTLRPRALRLGVSWIAALALCALSTSCQQPSSSDGAPGKTRRPPDGLGFSAPRSGSQRPVRAGGEHTGAAPPAAVQGVAMRDERFFGGDRVQLDPVRGALRQKRLNKVVILGHSLIGRDMDAEGGLAKALLNFFDAFDPPPAEVIVLGVGGTRIDHWTGDAPRWPRYAENAALLYPAELSPLRQILHEHEDADLFVVSLGANDVYMGIEAEMLSQRIINAEHIFHKANKPLIWVAHAWYRRQRMDSAAKEQSLSDLCLKGHKLAEAQLKGHPNTHFIYPRDYDQLMIYEDRGGSLHPPASVHRDFLRQTSGELLSFIGAQVVPNRSP